jgi:hypothetical protein
MESNQPEFSSPPSAPAPKGNERVMAIASLVLGVINLCAWFFPICGLPLGFVGVVLGVMGMKDQSQKTLAIIGIALSSIGLLLACGNAALGAYLAATGQGFQFPQ